MANISFDDLPDEAQAAPARPVLSFDDLPDEAPAAGADPFAGEGAGALAKRRGQEFALGATDMASSAMRGAAATQSTMERNVSPEGLEQRATEGPAADRAYAERLRGTIEESGLVSTPTPTTEKPLYAAAGRFDQWARDTVGTPPEDPSFWSKFSTGAGSMAAFMATTLLSGPAAPVAGATAGALANSGQIYQEAIDSGASEEDALDAAGVARLVGSAEIIPVLDILKPLDRAFPTLKSKVVAIAGKALRDATEEGLQEGLSQIANNLIASSYYDPERGWSEGVTESAVIGAMLGGGLGATVGAIRDPREQVEEAPAPQVDTSTPQRPARPTMQDPRPDLPFTPEQVASPIQTPLLQEGQAILDAAVAGEPIPDIPQGAVSAETLFGKPDEDEEATARPAPGTIAPAAPYAPNAADIAPDAMNPFHREERALALGYARGDLTPEQETVYGLLGNLTSPLGAEQDERERRIRAAVGAGRDDIARALLDQQAREARRASEATPSVEPGSPRYEAIRSNLAAKARQSAEDLEWSLAAYKDAGRADTPAPVAQSAPSTGPDGSPPIPAAVGEAPATPLPAATPGLVSPDRASAVRDRLRERLGLGEPQSEPLAPEPAVPAEAAAEAPVPAPAPAPAGQAAVSAEPAAPADAPKPLKPAPTRVTNLKGEKIAAPRRFYRGTNPGDTRRISTGNATWDEHLFVADSEKSASNYGRSIQTFEAKPEARILYEGTAEWNRVAGKIKKGENLLQYSDRAATAAREAGYDAAWFQRQSDVGTAIFNRDKFIAGPEPVAPKPKAAPAKAPSVQKKPFTYRMKALGIAPDSPAAAELAHAGITPKNTPGLFKKGGLADVDNLPSEEWQDVAHEIGVDGLYLSRQGVIDALVREHGGEAVRNAEQQALAQQKEAEQDHARRLEQATAFVTGRRDGGLRLSDDETARVVERSGIL